MTPRLSSRRVAPTCCQTGYPADAASKISREPINKLQLSDCMSVVALSHIKAVELKVASKCARFSSFWLPLIAPPSSSEQHRTFLKV
jgi:hypothetical protein